MRQDLCERSFRFAVDILQFYKEIARTKPLLLHPARQMLKAGTSVGANIEEGVAADSRRHMAAKYSISLRESRECRFWLRLIATEEDLTIRAQPLIKEAAEFVAMLSKSVRNLREYRGPTRPRDANASYQPSRSSTVQKR